MIGDGAPAFDLEEVGGGTLSLESMKGRFVVLHFGASW
jgi:peroxiredoxin